MHNRTVPALALVGLSAIFVASPAGAQPSTIIIAPDAPPAPRVENIPPPPDARVMSWQSGRWAWANGNWQWVDGRYVETPRPNAVWEPGHWEHHPAGGYNWIDGHWRG